MILLLCDHILAGEIISEADKVNMTNAGWAWIVWNEVADELIAWNSKDTVLMAIDILSSNPRSRDVI